jgi:hypothetical protein
MIESKHWNVVSTAGVPRGAQMKVFTDAEMNALLPTVRQYSVGILKAGTQFGTAGSQEIIWEHGRRNFGLRDDGVMPIVLPVADGSEVCGVCVFNATVEEATAIMRDDPGVRAGVFTFEVHACGGFPGDALPSG